MTANFHCPQRLLNEGAHVKAHTPSDQFGSDDTCSYCGSLNPETFIARIKAGDVEAVPTDKDYKAYLTNKGGAPFSLRHRTCSPRECNEAPCTHWTVSSREETKFYFVHLSIPQQEEFIALHNDSKINYAFPGHLYTTPFFCRKAMNNPPTSEDGS